MPKQRRPRALPRATAPSFRSERNQARTRPRLAEQYQQARRCGRVGSLIAVALGGDHADVWSGRVLNPVVVEGATGIDFWIAHGGSLIRVVYHGELALKPERVAKNILSRHYNGDCHIFLHSGGLAPRSQTAGGGPTKPSVERRA